MKNLSFITVFLWIALLVSTNASAQKKLTITKFKVSGNCEMCKATIEKSLDVNGVKVAEWNADTKMIEVVYNPDKILEDKIHQLIAASGYDTEKAKADDKIYGDLHSCCRYPRK